MAENLNHIGYHPDPPTTAQYRPVTFGSGAPSGGGWPNQPYFDEDTGDFYIYQNGSWTLISSGGGGGGGANEVTTGTSDPVGAPSAGVVFFARTDVIRVLQWNGSAWVVIVSEI